MCELIVQHLNSIGSKSILVVVPSIDIGNQFVTTYGVEITNRCAVLVTKCFDSATDLN